MRSHHLLLIIIPFLLSSCFVVHSGSVSSGPLFDRKDKYVDIGVGKSKSVFVFGFGNLNREDLVFKAKNNMHLSRPLAENEYYANFTTSITNKFILGFIHNTRVTVSADILQPPDTIKESFSKNFKRLISSENHLLHTKISKSMSATTDGNILIPGDSVYYAASLSQYRLFTALSVDKDNVLLKAADPSEKNKLVPLKSSFFVKNIEMNGFKSGNLIVFDYEDAENFGKPMDGLVLGISERKILITSEKGFFVLSPGKLKKKK